MDRHRPADLTMMLGCKCSEATQKTVFRFISLLLALAALLLLPTQHAAAEPASDVSGGNLILDLRLEKNRVYLHEPISVTVTLLAGSVSVRNIQYPRLGGKAFDIAEFGPPLQKNITRNGQEYNAYEFVTTLSTSKSGTFELGPAELRCDLLASAGGAAGFFGGSEPRSITVRSQPVSLTILPLPTRGRPAGFTGAVGHFTVSMQATPTEIQAGDAITLTTHIKGVGNLDGFSCAPNLLPVVRAYPPRTRRTENHLTCEQVLVPETGGEMEIPAARVSFFDPRTERYRTLRSSSISLKVSTPSGTDKAVAAQPPYSPPADRVGPPAQMQRRFVPFAIGLLLLVSLLLMAMYRRSKAKGGNSAARTSVPAVADWLAMAEQALAANDTINFHTAVFRALQGHLSAQHGLTAASITGDILTKVLQPAGVDDRLATSYAKLFIACDRARFAPGVSGDIQETLRLLREAIGQD